MDPQRLIPGDSTLIENIVNYLKAKGIFDEFRHECLADVDTKSSCQNLSQRVDGYASKFLGNETWHPDLNKNELRNKLRRNIDESGMLTVGADHVVEQVINPKIHQFFLPKIIEVVHQYVKERSELLSKKPETTASQTDIASTSEKAVSEPSDSKPKTSISDPIADILSFSYSKSKPVATNTNVKTENVQQKQTDLPKLEKKKEEKLTVSEKNPVEALSEGATATTETKPLIEKEKIKKEEPEISQEATKKPVKEELKPEKKKNDDTKVQGNEAVSPTDESKVSMSALTKPSVPAKKDNDKNKQKGKSSNSQKSNNTSNEVKKPKKESSEKSSEKHGKVKPTKSLKESSSPTKSVNIIKNVSKEEKIGESSKSKLSDSSSNKTSESSVKKMSKSINVKKDSNVKHKEYSEKTDKSKISKSIDKSDQSFHQDSSNSEKGAKSVHYSSSYDSSQGSDQEKSSSSSSKKERQKHFSKFAKKEKSDHADKNSKTSYDKKRSKDADEGIAKKLKHEKKKLEKLKDSTVVEAAKISSRSNSFGSTSSVSSSSNTSKDNLVSNSDEVSENSGKDKKKKQVKEKDTCHNPDVTLPPPPPPPPPPASSSLSCELMSSTEMSSMDDTQSSTDSETSSSGEISEEPLSDSEVEIKDLAHDTLDENVLNISAANASSFFEKLFLSSSSCSEFEGFESSPEKVNDDDFCDVHDSDVSVSSVHTSDLSDYNDELSDDDNFSLNYLGVKKRLTLKEAQELIQNKALSSKKKMNAPLENKSSTLPASYSNENRKQSSSSFSSIDDLENALKQENEEENLMLMSGSDISVSSVHTSDLSSFDDELSDDGLFSNGSPSGVKKRLTLKEAEELIRNKAISCDRIKNLPSENKSDITSPALNEKSTQKPSSLISSDEESTPSEPKRSLRRERKLNPRYASPEYTSIFNSKKETFITKQSTPSLKSHTLNSSPNSNQKIGKKDLTLEKNKSPKKSLVESKKQGVHEDEVEHSPKTKKVLNNLKSINEEKDLSNSSNVLSANETESIRDKDRLFEISKKSADNTDADHLKFHFKLKMQNNSKLNLNSHSLKRKLSVTESSPSKRPCNRSSIDSTSSEIISNENKPFNSEKQPLSDDKVLRDNNLKGSDLTAGIKKDLFCKQKTNNNGDILGQKDIFPKNSHGRTASNAEKKTTESDTSKELNAL